MTAHQEPNESKDRQKEGWHVSRLFDFSLFQVNRQNTLVGGRFS
jgi:hypothetical protein